MNIIEKIDKEIEALKIRKQDIQARCSHPDFSTERPIRFSAAMVRAWTRNQKKYSKRSVYVGSITSNPHKGGRA
jgi:hypothetical protein